MKRNALLATLTLGHGTLHWYTGAFWLILPVLARELDLSFSQVGLIISLRTLVSASSNLPAGAFSDMLGRRRPIMGLTLAILGIAYFTVGLASSYLLVLASIVFAGLGVGFWHPPAISMLGERFPERRGLALSVHGVGASVGESLAPLTVGYLLVLLTWKKVLYINILPGLLVGLLVWVVATEGRRVRGERVNLSLYFAGVRKLFGNLRFLGLSTASALRSMGHNALLTFLPLYLSNVLLMSSTVVGFYVSLLGFMGIFSSPVLGTLSDRFGRKPVLVIGLASTGLLALALARVNVGLQFILVLATLGLFIYSISAIILASAMDVSGSEVGATTVGFVLSANMAAASLSPLIAGSIADIFGVVYVFYFVGALILLSSALVFFIPLTQAAPSPRPQKAS